MIRIIGVVVAILMAFPAIAGPLRIIDGDTIDLDGVRYRLEGIDAPEMAQKCTSRVGTWDCGVQSRNALVRLTRGRDVTCKGDVQDRYGRTIGYCFAGGIDLNERMVQSGFAWAFRKYSDTYIAQEAVAQRAGLGIWQADTIPAWQYRAEKWQVAEQVAANGCVIKGNISKYGRIYHMPWQKWYSRTKINTSRGERWFCSETEAISAGWRKARE